MTVDDAEPRPLRYPIDLSSILEHTGASMTVTDVIDVGPLEVGGERFEQIRASSFEIDLVNSGSGIVATGTITAAYSVECSRCLDAFELPIVANVERFFVDQMTVESVPDQQEYDLISHGRVDLGSALIEALTLELPFVPLHDPDCPGICPTCGANLCEGPCACPPQTPASPFSGLAALLDPSAEATDDTLSDGPPSA